jgi:hypothetical protein
VMKPLKRKSDFLNLILRLLVMPVCVCLVKLCELKSIGRR